MPRFVRCIEGHVFDAEAAAQCPVCGAVFEVKPPPSTDVVPPSAAAPAATGAPNRSLIVAIVVAVLGVGLGAGALLYVLRGSSPPTITASNTPTPPAEKAKAKSEVDTAPPSTPSVAPATTTAENAPAQSPPDTVSKPKVAATPEPSQAPSAPIPPKPDASSAPQVTAVSEPSQTPTAPPPASPTTPAAIAAAPNAPPPAPAPANVAPGPKVAALPEPAQTPAVPSPPTAPSLNVSSTLQTTLDVARMLVAFRQKKYDDALAQASLLADRNNPIAMFVKAGILQNGLAGRQDSVGAQELLAKAAQLGDPTSQLFYAKMLEQGIGGAADPDKAKQLYLLASRGMATAADQEVARLHLDGARGMTALEAYQNLIGQNPSSTAGDVIHNLFMAQSTVAVCLGGWLAYRARTKGWTVRPAGIQSSSLTEEQVKVEVLKDFELGAVRHDPWCEWGMATLAAEGVSGYPKSQVEADVFYRLAAANRRLGPSAEQVKQQMADLESKMSAAEKAQAEGLLHSAVPSGGAP